MINRESNEKNLRWPDSQMTFLEAIALAVVGALSLAILPYVLAGIAMMGKALGWWE